MSHTRRRARLARGTALRLLRAVPDLRLAIALLFACSLAAPRAPLLFHHHAGGEHAHVHGDAVAAELLPHGDGELPHHATGGRRGRPAVTRAAGTADGHVHQQHRYHAAIVPAAIFVAITAPLARLAPPHSRRAPARHAAAAAARGPPLAPLV